MLWLTAPKKTWGGQWFPQGSFFVATFVAGGQVIASKSPTFLSCDTLCLTLKDDTTDNKRTGKRKTKCQRFCKIKRAASQCSKPTQCSTFAFAPTHQPKNESVSDKINIFAPNAI